MDLGNTVYIILFLIILIVVTLIWWLIFTNKVKKIENKASERLQVIDIVLAVKKEFLHKLSLILNVKLLSTVPKVLINNPQYLWSSLEREMFIKGLNEWEKEINKEIKNKENDKNIIESLQRVKDTTTRLEYNLFIYNNEVLKYNYLLVSKQGKFFLKTTVYKEKELINTPLNKDNLKELLE